MHLVARRDHIDRRYSLRSFQPHLRLKLDAERTTFLRQVVSHWGLKIPPVQLLGTLYFIQPPDVQPQRLQLNFKCLNSSSDYVSVISRAVWGASSKRHQVCSNALLFLRNSSRQVNSFIDRRNPLVFANFPEDEMSCSPLWWTHIITN
jgi:hypothetical protein